MIIQLVIIQLVYAISTSEPIFSSYNNRLTVLRSIWCWLKETVPAYWVETPWPKSNLIGKIFLQCLKNWHHPQRFKFPKWKVHRLRLVGCYKNAVLFSGDGAGIKEFTASLKVKSGCRPKFQSVAPQGRGHTKGSRPTNVTELKSFWGIVKYYGKFWNNLSSTMQPLYALIRTNASWTWSNECEQAFVEAKKHSLVIKC